MTQEEVTFFLAAPQALALYLALRERILRPGTEIQTRATQISFREKYIFAVVSLPRRKKDLGGILVSFGLPAPLNSPRIVAQSQPYPGRWTHHTLLRQATDMDEEFMGWMAQARAFAREK